ncbi:MAG: hypothetical protein OXN25_21810 [Candidatus Poribacteria bacterium]|nr:hypothetical protein [Candidatus Poribacteria bacterium]
MRKQQQTQIHDEEEVKPMTVTVHICPGERLFFEVPDDIDDIVDISMNDNPQLPYEEFKAALEEWDALVRKFAKPDAKPLSDYAVSREGIYEDHL